MLAGAPLDQDHGACVTAVRQPVAIVTGAARGGGRGVALALGGHAGTVVLVVRSTREHPNRSSGCARSARCPSTTPEVSDEP
jgi:NAD(P)-dependent dehydrogenase (short-subunit alcohol dehydrogenase family)